MLVSIWVGTPALAQESTVTLDLKVGGSRPERAYFSPEPWERWDGAGGGLILSFADLTLPGNAGRPLTFQRTFNSRHLIPNTAPGARQPGQRWQFGIAGVVMRVVEGVPVGPTGYFLDPDSLASILRAAPMLFTADGGTIPTVFATRADPNVSSSMRYAQSPYFHTYDRTTRTLNSPDGTISHYDETGWLIDFEDPYGNRVDLTWGTTTLQVVQNLGNGQSRVIDFTIDGRERVTSMTYQDRTWTYTFETPSGASHAELTRVDVPASVSWQFTYQNLGTTGFADLTRVTTPAGGHVDYDYNVAYVAVDNESIAMTGLKTRDAFDRDNTALGHWTITSTPGYPESQTTILTPSGERLVYVHGSDSANLVHLFTGSLAAVRREIYSASGALLQMEEATRTLVPSVRYSSSVWWGTLEVASSVVTRYDGAGASRTYTTNNTYLGTFGNYHRPSTIVETGSAGSRTTTLTYRDPATLSSFITGLVTDQKIEAGGETWWRSTGYNSSGFATDRYEFSTTQLGGLHTEFTPDGFGNLASTRKSSRLPTTFSYSWGQVAQTNTPKYSMTRSINQDGTVASETVGGRTTQFSYDQLGRPTQTTPPAGSAATGTTYASDGSSMTVSRAGATTTTYFDGFGRPTLIVGPGGTRTQTEYTANGQVYRTTLPFNPGASVGTQPKWTTFEYDALGRTTRQTNPDNTQVTTTYGLDSVTVADENNHTTTQRYLTYGRPDSGNLYQLTDADQQVWTYSHNALGQLTQVEAPGGIRRNWTYSANNLLATEVHPESGTVTYMYDDAGVLIGKRDAKSIVTAYGYDTNDRLTSVNAGGRVTTITYKDGTDDRDIVWADDVRSTFDYDAVGRLKSRSDLIGSAEYRTGYTYNVDDTVATVQYPNNQRVAYSYNADGQVTAVTNPDTNRVYASNFTYHPSGGLRTYTAGNGLPTTIEYDANRYWVSSINAGGSALGSAALQLTYGYDNVGNVSQIADGRDASKTQTFTYDSLDRLHTANASGSGPTTWDYDVHGNQQSSRFVYKPLNPFQFATVDGAPVQYDDNGNLTNAPNVVYHYGGRNLLDQVEAGAATTNYAYDSDDWRVKKETVGGSTTYFARGVGGQLLSERTVNPDGTTQTRNYIYAVSRLIAMSKFSHSPSDPGGGEPPTGPTTNPLCSWGDTMYSEETLNVDDCRVSPNQRYRLLMHSGGFLAVYDDNNGHATVWESEGNGTGPSHAYLWGHGNLVLYDVNDQIQWMSRTSGTPGAYLKVGNDGVVRIFDTSGTAVWTSTGFKRDRLRQGERLHIGEFLMSPDRQWELKFGDTGRLELWSLASGSVAWTRVNDFANPGYAILTTAGELELRDAANNAAYMTTNENPAAVFVVLDGGGIALYDTNGGAVWTMIPGTFFQP